MLVKYSAQEILGQALTYLQANTQITNFAAGSIARSIVESIAPEIGESDQENRGSLYKFMEDVLHQGYISRAKGDYLNLIGGLFSYPRRKEQVITEDGSMQLQFIDDDTYRAEIIQQVMSIMSSNYTALRFNLLLVPGVEDVVPFQYAMGTGSFKFIIIEDRNYNSVEVLEECKKVVDRYKGFGIKPLVAYPDYVPVDLKIRLEFLDSVPAQKRALIASTAKEVLINYLLDVPRGGVLVYNDIVQTIMNVSEEIHDFTILYYAINEMPVMLMNQSIEKDERYQVGNVEITYL